MTAKKNAGPATDRRPPTTTIPDSTRGDDDFDFDQRIVAQVDKGLWEALFDGHFRLAVRCDVCGRWLTANASKKAHRGPRCSARAGGAL